MRTNVDGCSLRLWTLIPAPDLGLNPVCQTTVGGLGHRKNLGTVPHAGGCPEGRRFRFRRSAPRGATLRDERTWLVTGCDRARRTHPASGTPRPLADVGSNEVAIRRQQLAETIPPAGVTSASGSGLIRAHALPSQGLTRHVRVWPRTVATSTIGSRSRIRRRPVLTRRGRRPLPGSRP